MGKNKGGEILSDQIRSDPIRSDPKLPAPSDFLSAPLSGTPRNKNPPVSIFFSRSSARLFAAHGLQHLSEVLTRFSRLALRAHGLRKNFCTARWDQVEVADKLNWGCALVGASFHPRKLKTLMIPTAWTALIRVACSPWLANFDRNPLSAPARETPQNTTPMAKKRLLK